GTPNSVPGVTTQTCERSMQSISVLSLLGLQVREVADIPLPAFYPSSSDSVLVCGPEGYALSSHSLMKLEVTPSGQWEDNLISAYVWPLRDWGDYFADVLIANIRPATLLMIK